MLHLPKSKTACFFLNGNYGVRGGHPRLEGARFQESRKMVWLRYGIGGKVGSMLRKVGGIQFLFSPEADLISQGLHSASVYFLRLSCEEKSL